MESDQPETETRDAPEIERDAPRQSNLPLIITLAALLLYFGFQTVQLTSQRSELTALKRRQEAPVEASQKIEEQFKSIMTKTSDLAQQGHAGAKMVLEGLQQSAGAEAKPGQ